MAKSSLAHKPKRLQSVSRAFVGVLLSLGVCALLAGLSPLSANTKSIKDIEKDIQDNKAKLQQKAQEERKISNRLTTLGNTINERKRQITKLREQITFIQKNITQNQSQNQTQERRLDGLRKALRTLEEEKSKIQFYIANLIIKDLTFQLVLDKQSVISPDDVILEDIFEILTKQTKEKIVGLSEKQGKIAEQIGSITKNIDEITHLIGTQQNRKEQLQRMINEQNLLNEKLQAELNDYNERLLQISKERDGLDNILQELNIIKAKTQKEIEKERQKAIAAEKERQEKERLEREKQAKSQQATTPQAQTPAPPTKEAPKILQVANSYKDVPVMKYTGPKTISPLEYYTVEQSFGQYNDPVYNLKVFNQSITLISKVPNAVVQNIFEGKVVFAKEVSSMLKKVVVIEHGNEIFTIYSQLDKIAPTVKPGFIVKKGYTIGRVSQRLGLEITQKDKHIDPLEVISKSK